MRKNMTRLLCLLLVLMMPVLSLAERVWLIADSDSRYLSESELWEWDYESLGYILNEIFARHGYVFEPGGCYEAYFNCMPWYTPNADSNNSRACYSQMNKIEWYNESLVKSVRQEMRDLRTTNRGGKSVWKYFSSGFDTLQGFESITLKANQKLKVYSAPDTYSWRGANGKAAVATNGAIYCAGWESGFLLVMYETNSGSVRVGYVDADSIKGSIPVRKQLDFAYSEATLTEKASLTDDPARNNSRICMLQAGERVTYLTTFYNRNAWDYIETDYNGQTVRGFIKAGSLEGIGQDRQGAESQDTSDWEETDADG